MAIGGTDPYPRVIGGAQSLPLKIHGALRSAVGARDGGGAGPLFWEGGLEDRWRWIKALMIARAASLQEQALLEFFPHTMTPSLELWEYALGILRAPSTQERRSAVADVWTQPASAVASDVQGYLQETFDAAITVDLDTTESMTVTYLHKALGDRSGAVPFGPRGASNLPNYAGSYILRVEWPGDHDEITLEPVRAYLCKILPSWMDFVIYESKGFILGTSKLGRTALSW